LLDWVPLNLFLFVLPFHAGLSASGAFRALLNLFVPVIQGISALGILCMPILVRVWRATPREYARLVLRLSYGFAVMATGYGLVLTGFGRPLMAWLYDGRYSEVSQYIALMATAPIFAALAAVFGSALRAAERPDLVFRAYFAPTLAAGVIGALAAYRGGVQGASIGWLLTYAAAAVALFMIFRTWSTGLNIGGSRQHDDD
jgi:O-antigen/teichoic acid export membrane protein